MSIFQEDVNETEEWQKEQAERMVKRRKYILTCEYCGLSWRSDGESLSMGGDEACPGCRKLWNRYG